MKKILVLTTIAILSSCNQKNQSFHLCGLGITKPYYYTGLKYVGEIYQIEKEIRNKYNRVYTNNNGIARVRFKVNCEGLIGDLYYEEYDMQYRPTELNDSIKLQLIDGVSNLSQWIPGTNDDGDPVNSHSFLSFRIMNGEIIEILPK